MAQVLLARATGIEGFERYVVIKQIHVESARDKGVVKMFIDEARMAAALHHANIVQVHDVGQDKGEYFIAMEYIHGEDLRTLLSRLSTNGEQLPIEHLLTVALATAAALHHAHEQRGPDRAPLGLVHRDVSPANILVGYDGNVKVVDFGIAKAAHRSTETHSGTLKGKISYMAPEQCLGQPVDRRSYVFALGIVLYELFTVRRLFKASSDFLTMSAIVSGHVPRPSLHRELPIQLENIIMKALSLSPADRYQTADEMRVALDRAASTLGLRSSTTALADYMVTQFGRRPEPWTVDDDEAEIAYVDVDFDGSASGVVSASEATAGLPTPPVGSLLAKARRRAETAGQPPQRARTPNPEFDDSKPTTASGTPMAWATRPGSTKSHRWKWVAILAGPMIAIGAAAIVIADWGRSNDSGERALVPERRMAAGTAAAPTPAPAAPAPAPTLTLTPKTAETPKTAPAPAAAAGSPPPTPKQTAKPKVAKVVKPKAAEPTPAPPKPDQPAATWDPDALFIKKPAP